jgi:hypothetical protein
MIKLGLATPPQREVSCYGFCLPNSANQKPPGACVLWVKYPGERQVEEVTSGTNDVVGRVSGGAWRKWLTENKQLRDVERSDVTQLIDAACNSRS